MTPEFVRDGAAAGAILGFFATAWYAWALEDPPKTWRPWIFAGLAAAWVAVAVGVAVTWIKRDSGTIFDSSTGPVFGLVVGLEFMVAGTGAWILKRSGRDALIPPWIALVVGVHFFPLGYVLAIPVLHPLAVATTLAAVLSLVVARATSPPTSTVTGMMTGSCLLAGAIMSLATAA